MANKPILEKRTSALSLRHFFTLSRHTLTLIVWLSTLLFGLYILAFYGASFLVDPEQWNTSLKGLYIADSNVANNGIGLHFFAGGVILILGCIQLIPSLRQRLPSLHRISGRIYLFACFVTALGGLIFIAVRGTIGGLVMDIGFGLYGALMLVCAVQTARYAVRRDLLHHRAWALRLFALAIGSWLYRMEYGLWFMAVDAWGHQDDFRGWFDQIMAFFFFLPNLLVVELILRAPKLQQSNTSLLVSGVICSAAAVLIAVGTWAFWDLFWSTPILTFLRLA